MAECVIRVGAFSAKGVRPNNEDSFVVDETNRLFVVADGMGGMACGEVASSMAVDIIPRVVARGLNGQDSPDALVQRAMAEANQAIIAASQEQPHNSRMGTTAVMALERQGRVFVASLGDSRAYLVRGDEVHLLTIDHSVAQELVNHGVLSESEAKHSPLQHVLYRFLGCTQMDERTDVVQFAPEPGDLLLLASDGLTNYIDENDLRRIRHCPDPQNGCEQLVQLSLDRGSSDNVTCILVAFEAKDDE